MPFDPTQFGATPVTAGAAPTAGFDPSQFGATAAETQPQPAPAPTSTEPALPSTGEALDQADHVIGSIFPGQKVGQAIGTLGGYGVSALLDAFNHVMGKPTQYAKNFDTSAPSPLQVAGDEANGAALVGGVAAPEVSGLGKAALQGVKLGAEAGGGTAAENTSGNPIPTLSDAERTATGIGEGGAVGAATNSAFYGIGHLLAALGDKITGSVIKPTQRDIKDGFSVDTVNKYNLGGSLSQMYNNTQSKLSDLASQLNTKLGASNAAVDLNDVFNKTSASLAANTHAGFGSNGQIGNALEQLQNEVMALPKPQVSIPEAQLVKQASGKMGAWQYGVQDPDAIAREQVYNTFYSNLKQAIEDNSPPGVRDINRQISELIPVQNAIVRRIPVAERNNALSLTDMVGLVGSAMNPHALTGLGISLAQKSGAVGHLLSRFVGPGVAQAGAPLASGAGALSSVAQPADGNTQ